MPVSQRRRNAKETVPNERGTQTGRIYEQDHVPGFRCVHGRSLEFCRAEEVLTGDSRFDCSLATDRAGDQCRDGAGRSRALRLLRRHRLVVAASVSGRDDTARGARHARTAADGLW